MSTWTSCGHCSSAATPCRRWLASPEDGVAIALTRWAQGFVQPCKAQQAAVPDQKKPADCHAGAEERKEGNADADESPVGRTVLLAGDAVADHDGTVARLAFAAL